MCIRTTIFLHRYHWPIISEHLAKIWSICKQEDAGELAASKFWRPIFEVMSCTICLCTTYWRQQDIQTRDDQATNDNVIRKQLFLQARDNKLEHKIKNDPNCRTQFLDAQLRTGWLLFWYFLYINTGTQHLLTTMPKDCKHCEREALYHAQFPRLMGRKSNYASSFAFERRLLIHAPNWWSTKGWKNSISQCFLSTKAFYPVWIIVVTCKKKMYTAVPASCWAGSRFPDYWFCSSFVLGCRSN